MSVKETLENNKEHVITSYLAGASTCALGRELGCSNASVYLQLRGWGVPLRETKVVARNMAAIRRLHESGLTAYRIDRELQLPRGTSERALKKVGINISHRKRRRPDPLTNHRDEIVAAYAAGEGAYLLGRRYGCQDSTIVRRLQKWGVALRPLRRIGVDESFFDRIDTEVKAYVLGFWFADGNNDSRTPCVRLSITDEDILRDMANAMSYRGALSVVQPRRKSKLVQFKLAIGSRRLSDSLTRLGCVKRKTYTATFPTDAQVPPALVRHFIRGLSDGDGTITGGGCGKWHARIVGTRGICDGLARVTREHLGVSGSVCPVHKGPQHTTYAFTVSGRHKLSAYLDWLYADATIFLKRKHSKYIQCVDSGAGA